MSSPFLMARKNESPQKAAMREMMRSYLKGNGISVKDGADVNAVMRDRCPCCLKEPWIRSLTRNLATRSTITGTKIPITAGTGIPKRLCIPAMGIWMWQFPVTVMVNMSPSSLRSTRIL